MAKRKKGLDTSDETKRFDPKNLDKTILAVPLLQNVEGPEKKLGRLPVIIDLNLLFPGGRRKARETALEQIARVVGESDGVEALYDLKIVDRLKSRYSNQYLFASLTGDELCELAREEQGALTGGKRSIYKIWPDFEIHSLLERSVGTIKADAARVAFSAEGARVTWAVLDSGIDGEHEHFEEYGNLELDAPLHHMDFTTSAARDLGSGNRNLRDPFGHGTHVAGIIAGGCGPRRNRAPLRAAFRTRSTDGGVKYILGEMPELWGVAPRAKLLSVRVLDAEGRGKVSSLIAALGYIQELNGDGRWLRVQGVNLSVGYEFDAEWFACGHSPLCVEVNRLVRSGVAVVAAAGNTGYGFAHGTDEVRKGGLDLTINDPGNADLAITVGATHREFPHRYGVSYFSSKGPTGDGRLKPDLVAPGEKVVSCATRAQEDEIRRDLGTRKKVPYHEMSGTSMAAPHVSGAIAAFLSIRREFIGQPERVKEIFLSTATDLGRERYFQGHGLVDLMRAIQSV